MALLFQHEGERIAEEVADDGQMRRRVLRAAKALLEEQGAMEAAGRELVASGQEETPRKAEAMVARASRGIISRME